MEETIKSRPFHPSACCEKCVFGRGEHAEWCELPVRYGLTQKEIEDGVAKLIREHRETEMVKKHLKDSLDAAIETMEYAVNPPWPGYRTQEDIETWHTTQRGTNN